MALLALKVVMAVMLCGSLVTATRRYDTNADRNKSVQNSCYHTSTDVVSYFVNPSFPNNDTAKSACNYRIDITNENVCQIRLDFEQMSILGPDRTIGNCHMDQLTISTKPRNVLGLSELCGENTDQHMYVAINAEDGSAILSLLVLTSGVQAYKWRIRIEQIDCKLQPELVAPMGCLQYHDALSGSIMSFNYAGGHGQYQSNLEYTICIKRWLDTCRVEYKQVNQSVFWINSAEGTNLTESIGRTGTYSCDLSSHDYLHIPDGRGSTNGSVDNRGGFSSMSSEKFCGRSLSGLAVKEYAQWLISGHVVDPLDKASVLSTVTSYASGPIEVGFHSDNMVEAEREIGFHFTFEQLNTGCMD